MDDGAGTTDPVTDAVPAKDATATNSVAKSPKPRASKTTASDAKNKTSSTVPSPKKKREGHFGGKEWSDTCMSSLIAGVTKHGRRWQAIKRDEEFGELLRDFSLDAMKHKWKNMLRLGIVKSGDGDKKPVESAKRRPAHATDGSAGVASQMKRPAKTEKVGGGTPNKATAEAEEQATGGTSAPKRKTTEESVPPKQKTSASRKRKKQSVDVDPVAIVPDPETTPDSSTPESACETLRVELSAGLKKELLVAMEKITREGYLATTPSSVPVSLVLRRWQDEAVVRAKTAAQGESATACAAGLISYFNQTLRNSLLYPEESEQAETVLGSSSEKTQNVSPSEVYGAEHLLRLFVKLPELVPVEDMDAAAMRAVTQKLQEVSRWMLKNLAANFTRDFFSVAGETKETESGPMETAVEA